jgi:hypothetical protein
LVRSTKARTSPPVTARFAALTSNVTVGFTPPNGATLAVASTVPVATPPLVDWTSSVRLAAGVPRGSTTTDTLVSVPGKPTMKVWAAVAPERMVVKLPVGNTLLFWSTTGVAWPACGSDRRAAAIARVAAASRAGRSVGSVRRSGRRGEMHCRSAALIMVKVLLSAGKGPGT